MKRQKRTYTRRKKIDMTENSENDVAEIVAVVEETAGQSGIICPRCRAQMRVCYTRKNFGTVDRVRVCDRCGHKTPTTEK